MAVGLERLPKRELISLLRRLQAQPPADAPETTRLIHELEMHQIELEMQNRELREAQVELQQSHRRYADLYDLAPVVYLSLDVTGKVREANLTAASLFGVPRGQLIGRLLVSLAKADDPRLLREHLRRCLVDRIRTTTEITLAPIGLATVTMQVVSTPLIGPDGATEGCKMTMTDISSLKRTQQRLSLLTHAGAVLASSFDTPSTLSQVVGLCVPLLADLAFVDVLDRDGRLRRIEVAVAEPRQRAMARTATGMVYRPKESTPIGEVLATGKPILFEQCTPGALGGGAAHETLIKAAGARSLMFVPIMAREVPLGVFTFAMTTSDRWFTADDLVTAEDLATRAALALESARHYEDAERASRSRRDLLAFVSHDLKNPLTGIMLTAELMLAAVPQEERRKGWRQLTRIRRSAHQMRRMIEDLLDVASIEGGRLSVQVADHDLTALCEDALELMQPLAAGKQIKLAATLPPGTVAVCCDRDRTLQVFSNVLGNAIKFTPTGGRIELTVDLSETSAVVAVRDSGPGVPERQLPRLFERFWQADETARHGRGLGLFIARGIVEAQNGEIRAESRPGAGATFSFTLPLASVRERPQTPVVPPIEREPVISGAPSPERF
jgi:PAS domain S-box-containing protein